jgi:hypothetical protein
MALGEDEKSRWFFRQIEQELLKGRPGVVSYEELWKLMGVPGQPADTKLKTRLIEMGAVRNLIVHRSGMADAKFLTECPKFPVKVGEHVEVNGVLAKRYLSAVVQYAEELMSRLFAWNGLQNNSFHSGRDHLKLGERLAMKKRLVKRRRRDLKSGPGDK